ncbi:rod shape-determining protein MreC [Patescibacteria group bacterium]|nr:rod shape-determining protein MreC [Patescibacteria group bacterium]
MARTTFGLFERQRSQLSFWLVIGLIVLLVAVLEYAGVLIWMRGGLEQGVRPLLRTGALVVRAVRYPAELIRVATRRYTYVLDLELRYAESAAQLSELERLRQENQSLRTILEGEQATRSATGQQRRLAAVLSYAQPTIGLGNQDGLKEGSAIFVQGALIGKVTQLTEHQSQVKLLQSYGAGDLLLVQTETGVSGLLSGDGQDILFKELPIDAQVEVGQRVETSGQVGVLPRLYIGRIESIRREEGSPTQTAVIDQGVSLYRTSIVEVLP